MKKLIIIALLVGLFYSHGICQGPTLYNYNTVPRINQTIIQMLGDSNIQFNNTDTNYTWDYSTVKISYNNKLNEYYDDPDKTNYGSSFPNATLAEGAASFSYYYADTNEYSWIGDGSYYYVMFCSNPMKLFNYPFKYGNQFNDSFNATYTNSGKLHTFSGTNSVVADGWGILKLPKYTYPNVLRTKREFYIKDSTDVSTFERYQTIICWYDGIHNVPLMKIISEKHYSSGNPNPTFLKSFMVVDVTNPVSIPPSINSITFNVFPNPTNKELNIELNLNHRTNIDITLVDINGNIVSSIDNKVLELGKYQNTIDISGLLKGIYAVKIISDNEVQVKRILTQ